MKGSSGKENIVIVGGGLSGSYLAKELSTKLDHSKYNLIVVEARSKLVYVIGGARMAVTDEDGGVDKYLIKYDKLFPEGKGSVKKAKVEKIVPDELDNGGELLLSGGETLPYRFLVLATGSKWTGPIAYPDDDADIPQFVTGWQQRFKSAADVVIVGGGSVGIELAGELRDEYPEKKITIIQGDTMLLNSAYPNKFRKYMESQLRARNIDLLLGDYVDKVPENGSGKLEFRSGRSIQASLVVTTSGPKPNTTMILESLGEDVLTERGNVKVLETLQLPSHKSIFALGDIIDWDEQKQAFKSYSHSSVIADNILNLLDTVSKDEGAKEGQKKYKKGREVIIVTNGKNGGAMFISFLWGITLGNWAAKMLKAKDLGLSMITPRMTGA